MRSLFRSAHLRDVKVGTVDDYQGQEGKAIFISATVSRRYGMSDVSSHAAAVSFIGNPRRFNVALSRAQHMLVVVGDPWILSMDRCGASRVALHLSRQRSNFFARCWGALLRFCVGNGVYKGCPLPPSLMHTAQVAR